MNQIPIELQQRLAKDVASLRISMAPGQLFSWRPCLTCVGPGYQLELHPVWNRDPAFGSLTFNLGSDLIEVDIQDQEASRLIDCLMGKGVNHVPAPDARALSPRKLDVVKSLERRGDELAAALRGLLASVDRFNHGDRAPITRDTYAYGRAESALARMDGAR